MTKDLSTWSPCPRPERRVLDGQYVRLEPLSAAAHRDDLFYASTVPDADTLFRWLAEYPPANREAFSEWMVRSEASPDPFYYAVIDKQTRQAVGRQSLMRIDTANGVIEIGNIYWSPAMARTRGATEALFLFMRHVFDDLGYRRFEWKCNNDNAPSKAAALRFGFLAEGVFRQHMIVKGLSRDTAWFAIVDEDWPALKTAYEAWLNPENFDVSGQQKARLQSFMA